MPVRWLYVPLSSGNRPDVYKRQIYTKFTNGSGNYATYQLTLNTDRDVVVK